MAILSVAGRAETIDEGSGTCSGLLISAGLGPEELGSRLENVERIFAVGTIVKNSYLATAQPLTHTQGRGNMHAQT